MKGIFKVFGVLAIVIIMLTGNIVAVLGTGITERTSIDEISYSISNNIITVNWGEKPTGGYSISITDLKLDSSNNLLVYFKTESPKPGDFVTLAITYPRDSRAIPSELRGFRGVILVEESVTNEVTYSISNNRVTINWGEKRTGGYSIKIKELRMDTNNNLLVYYDTKSPNPEDFVTQAITYPSDSMLIPVELRGYRGVRLIDKIDIDEITYSISNNVFTLNWGEKTTGGYEIKITDFRLDSNNNLLVYYNTQSPKAGDFVIQAITYPKDSKVIPLELRGYRAVRPIENVELDEVTYSISNDIIILSWGEKPTGGYSIKITDLKLDNNNNLVVYFRRESPKTGDIVSQVISYPRDSMVIPAELRGYRGVILAEHIVVGDVSYSIVNNAITLNWGEKPTGGYSIKITELKLDKNKNLLVYYKTEIPKQGDIVTQGVTYPKDTMIIPSALRNYNDVKLILVKETNKDNIGDRSRGKGKGPDFDKKIEQTINKAIEKINRINNRISDNKYNDKQIEKFKEQLARTINQTNERVEHFLERLEFFSDRYTERELLEAKNNIERRLAILQRNSRLSPNKKAALKSRPVSERLYIRGVKPTYDVPPIIKDGRTLVPVAIISEHLGANVKWEKNIQKVTITRGEIIIELWINNKIAKVNGRDVVLDVPVQRINGRTMVPITFICEALGESLDYSSETGDIDIGNRALDVLILLL